MIRQHRAHEIPERQRLDILLRYQKIKDGASDESIADLCQEYHINRNYPARLLSKALQNGRLRSKQRKGRPSKVKDPQLQNHLVEFVLEGKSIAVMTQLTS